MPNSIPEQSQLAALDLALIRSQFPSLSREVNGRPACFLDGPGGTQVPQRVIDAIAEYLRTNNANTCGAYATSRYTDQMIANARSAMGDFLGGDADEVVFGPNMTTLTYAMSRAIGRELQPGDEILLTHLDHDANISPWRALEERGVKIQFVDIHEEDCTLDMDDLARKITKRTKIVAIGYASNAVGTINDVKTIVKVAHDAGAMAYIDAVHYAPHGPIDVRDLDCDFLVCSTYKFFGPHMGVLYGKREHLARLEPYKLRANTNAVPQRWEWGTLNHECIAGIAACVDYLAELGVRGELEVTNKMGASSLPRSVRQRSGIPAGGIAGESENTAVSARGEALLTAFRRQAIQLGYRAIQSHEPRLALRMLRGLKEIPNLHLYGIADESRLRCPTFAIRIAGHTPLELATKLGRQGIFTWDGNYYAINLTERLGVEKDGGFLRIGLVHYNTEEEVDRVLDALRHHAQ
jgi:cysteine desulfurase family protein (TIGR01976 family)